MVYEIGEWEKTFIVLCSKKIAAVTRLRQKMK